MNNSEDPSMTTACHGLQNNLHVNHFLETTVAVVIIVVYVGMLVLLFNHTCFFGKTFFLLFWAQEKVKPIEKLFNSGSKMVQIDLFVDWQSFYDNFHTYLEAK